MKRSIHLALLILFLFINAGCAVIGAAVAAGAGYAISRAINGGW